MIGTITLFAALILTPLQGGQGGAGGFGGGALGGAQGGAGGQMGRMGHEQTYSHILTPGDKTEWPFKVKAGEVIIFSARSDSFDPAIEVQDADKKKIAENDDEEPGKQDALLLVYFEKEGSYTAHVKNYRSTAGGPYTFRTRRFLTTTIPLDKPVEVEGNAGNTFLRIPATKGKVISLFNSRSQSFSTLIGPDAKEASWLQLNDETWPYHFRATQDGAYYVQTYVSTMGEAKSIISAITAREHNLEVNRPQTVGPHAGLDIWKYKAKAGDFHKFGADITGSLRVKMGPYPPQPEEEEGKQAPFQVIGENTKWSKSTAVLFHKDGEYEIFVNPFGHEKGYTFAANQAWKPWDGLTSVEGDLEIGETVYYGFDAKPGHVVRIQGSAATFDLSLEVHNDKWQVVFQQDDSNGTSNPEGTLFLSTGGRHYLAVSCYGDGGGGPYRLGVTPIKPTIIRLGETKEASLTSPLDGLWSITVDKPGTYSIRLKGSNGYVGLMDPDGLPVNIRNVMVQPGDWLMFFDIKKAGEYRLWKPFNGTPEKYSMTFDTVKG